MTISIIIPVYNQAEYLREAVDSVLKQRTRYSFEVIIVDDGSTDDSGKIADSYGIMSAVKVIHQVNKGLPSARNTGIMNATGEYIAFLDADDMFEPDYIEKVVSMFLMTKADIVAPSFTCFGESNTEVILGNHITAKSLASANRIGYFSTVKKSALLEVGGFSPRMLQGYEDWHIWCDLANRGKVIVTLTESLVRYRVKKVSMITEAIKHDKELRDQIKKDFPEIYA